MGTDAFLRVGEAHASACCHSGRVLPSPTLASWATHVRSSPGRQLWCGSYEAVAGKGVSEILAWATKQQRAHKVHAQRCKTTAAVLTEIPALVSEDTFPRGAHWQVGHFSAMELG